MRYLYIPFSDEELESMDFPEDDLFGLALYWKTTKARHGKEYRIVSYDPKKTCLKTVKETDVIYVLGHGVPGTTNIAPNSLKSSETALLLSQKTVADRLKKSGIPKTPVQIKLYDCDESNTAKERADLFAKSFRQDSSLERLSYYPDVLLATPHPKTGKKVASKRKEKFTRKDVKSMIDKAISGTLDKQLFGTLLGLLSKAQQQALIQSLPTEEKEKLDSQGFFEISGKKDPVYFQLYNKSGLIPIGHASAHRQDVYFKPRSPEKSKAEGVCPAKKRKRKKKRGK